MCIVGNEEDLQMGLGIPGPEVAAKSKLDPSTFFGMIDQVVQKYPQVKIVATTLREVHSTNRHSWGAVAWIDGQTYVSPTCELDILDRVGGGDGLCVRVLLRSAGRRRAARSGQSGLGAWRAVDDVPRRHDDGHGGSGAGLCQRRIGAHSALISNAGHAD